MKRPRAGDETVTGATSRIGPSEQYVLMIIIKIIIITPICLITRSNTQMQIALLPPAMRLHHHTSAYGMLYETCDGLQPLQFRHTLELTHKPKNMDATPPLMPLSIDWKSAVQWPQTHRTYLEFHRSGASQTLTDLHSVIPVKRLLLR